MAARGRAALTEVAMDRGGMVQFLRTARAVLAKPVNLIRSAVIGQIIAIIPGAGGSITSLVAYDAARRGSKQPETFGKGNVEGLVASETSNNVMVAGSMVPLLTLGIPGAPPDAVILGVMMLHGLRPGIELFTVSGVLTNGFILSMGVAALMMLPVGLLGGRLIYGIIVKTPYYFLVPSIALVTILGTFALRNSMLDVLIMLVLGVAGYLLRSIGIPLAPVVLGLILGQIAETGYTQSVLGGMAYAVPQLRLVENTLSQILIVMVVLAISGPAYLRLKRKWRERHGTEVSSE
jgi:putative tricarboxylic transport membrane protein